MPKESYEEIPIANKLEYYKNHNPFVEDRFNENVQCLHCGKKFAFNEFKVVRKKIRNGMEFIVCKYFPDCNGSLIDFMPVKRNKMKK